MSGGGCHKPAITVGEVWRSNKQASPHIDRVAQNNLVSSTAGSEACYKTKSTVTSSSREGHSFEIKNKRIEVKYLSGGGGDGGDLQSGQGSFILTFIASSIPASNCWSTRGRGYWNARELGGIRKQRVAKETMGW